MVGQNIAGDTPQVDAATGTTTTGHEWDGIRELNTPLPRWWLWVFYACIVWAVGYWIVYPAWPLIASYTGGAFGWQSRDAIVADLAGLKARRGAMMERLAVAPLQEIRSDERLLEFARAQGRAAFADNCSACHGSGGAGGKGFPNLNDDDWLWGGKLDDIETTIEHGVRANDPDTRVGGMPAFGRENMLSRADISAAADYVRSLSGLAQPSAADAARGKKIFADTCSTCHGEDAKGNRELGAPNLTDKIWLYGSAKETIVEGLTNGRGGVMPAWAGRLDPTTIKALAVYVHTFGGGEK
jgi:cytochrome c oxidase cbb3-type subunit III